MLKRLFIIAALGLLPLLAAAPARAACTLTSGGLSITTQPGSTNVNNPFSMSLDANSNCSANTTIGAMVGGSATPLLACDSVATYNASTSGATQLVAAVSGKAVYVCGYTITVGTTATNVGLVYGTGTNCATGLSATGMPGSGGATFTGFPLPAGANLVDRAPYWSGIATPASDALCLDTSAGNPVAAVVYYDQH